MALAASGHRYELREVALKDKPGAMLLASPKGTVPVLVLPDGRVIDESLDIMRWSLHLADPLGWLPVDETTSQRWDHWIALCDGQFKMLLDRYKYPHRFGFADGHTFRDQGLTILQVWQEALKDNRYLGGEKFAMVDAAIAPFVRQFAHTDKDWFSAQALDALQAWLHRFESSALFQSVMHKHSPWVEGQSPIVSRTATDELTTGNEKMIA